MYNGHLQDVLVVELDLPEGLVKGVPLVPEDLLKPDVGVLPVDVVQIRGRKSEKMRKSRQVAFAAFAALLHFLKNGSTPASFSFSFVFSKYSTEKFRSQWDSNADCQSRRQGY